MLCLVFGTQQWRSLGGDREWLETNGLGGYACGTLSGARTRRYHSLLTASLASGRRVLLAGVEEELTIGTQKIALTPLGKKNGNSAEVPDRVSFCRQPWAKWTFEGSWGKVEKTLFLPYLSNSVYLRYRMDTAEPAALTVRLFVTERDHHWISRRDQGFWVRSASSHRLEVGRVGDSKGFLHIAHNGRFCDWESAGWVGLPLEVERERGLEDYEELFCIGSIVKMWEKDGRLDLVAGVEPEDLWEIAWREWREDSRRRETIGDGGDALYRALLEAADQFIVLSSRQRQWTVIAGYPWFTDWGRDTLISLPGLTLVTGRFRISRQILLRFASRISDGLVPNFFPEGEGEPAYNTVDASLWFLHAVGYFLRYRADGELLGDIWIKVKEIIESYCDGTRYGIKVDPRDGLVGWEAEGEALTWMDAKVWERPVTPRAGKPVEVNALWCNGLANGLRWARSVGDRKAEGLIRRLLDKALKSFAPTFWNQERGCLYDVIEPDGVPDRSVRCNQLLAVSLPVRLLSADRERSVLRVVERDLLTPVGLRSLAPYDPAYQGRCTGPPAIRDAAYHQGTVWGWWWGPYCDAVARVDGVKGIKNKVAPRIFTFLNTHLYEGCVGSVSEIFDGDPPHHPRGCFAQAWSVAEILRVYDRIVKGAC